MKADLTLHREHKKVHVKKFNREKPGKWTNLMKSIDKGRYTFSNNFYVNGQPYLHSSAFTFTNAAAIIAPPLDFNKNNKAAELFLKKFDNVINKKRKVAQEIYKAFNGMPNYSNGREAFLDLLNNEHFDTSNQFNKYFEGLTGSMIKEVRNAIETALDDAIVSKISGNTGDRSFSTKKEIIDISNTVVNAINSNDKLTQAAKDKFIKLLKYSPRDNKNYRYFMLEYLFGIDTNKQHIRRITLESIKNSLDSSLSRQLSGKINYIIGDLGEAAAKKLLVEATKEINSKMRIKNTGSGYTNGKRNLADLVIEIDGEEVNGKITKTVAGISVKTGRSYTVNDTTKSLEVLTDKFRDTTIQSLLNVFKGEGENDIQKFLTYLIVNICNIKVNGNNPVFAGNKSSINRANGLAAVENMANSILSLGAGLMFDRNLEDLNKKSSVNLQADFIINPRTQKVISVVDIMEAIRNNVIAVIARKDNRSTTYHVGRFILSTNDTFKEGMETNTNITEMNIKKRESLIGRENDDVFTYPESLLKVGRNFGDEALGSIANNNIKINLSVVTNLINNAKTAINNLP